MGGPLNPCNYCVLKELKREAAQRGMTITHRAAPETIGPTAVTVYRHARDQEPTEKNWVATFMKLTERCACW